MPYHKIPHGSDPKVFHRGGWIDIRFWWMTFRLESWWNPSYIGWFRTLRGHALAWEMGHLFVSIHRIR